MKNIDENYFKQTEETKVASTADLLNSREKVLWKGRPKKFAYVMSKSISMMPIALIWGAIDFTIIFTALPSFDEVGGLVIFFVFFFALHLMPVWIWLGSIIKATKEMKTLEYVITNKRILEVRGGQNKYLQCQVDLDDLKTVNLKKSFIDKMLKVGDIYISGNKGKNIVLFDITNSEFITNKISGLCLNNKETTAKKAEFYKNNYECSHCGTYYDANVSKCPSCGAPRERE